MSAGIKNRISHSIVGLALVFAGHAQGEMGVTDQEILLGQSAALTGPAAELGTQVKAGAEAYFKKINDAGGIHGRRIRLVSLDDGYEPERAAKNTHTLIEKEKVFALFGYVGTPTSNAAAPLFTAARVPFFAPYTGAESLRTPMNHYIFNVRASYFDETEAIIAFIRSPMYRKVAVVYQNDAYGQAGLKGVEQALAKLKVEPVLKTTIERNSVDVSKAVADVVEAKPEAVIVISTYKSAAALIKEVKWIAPEVKFWNVSFVGSRALSDELGDDGRGVAISQVVPFPWSDRTPVAKEHRQLYGEQISFTTLEGFIAAKTLVEGLKRAGRHLTREGLIGALESAGTLNLGGFLVNYTPHDHNGSHYVDLTLISKNGKFIQ